VNTNKDTKC